MSFKNKFQEGKDKFNSVKQGTNEIIKAGQQLTKQISDDPYSSKTRETVESFISQVSEYADEIETIPGLPVGFRNEIISKIDEELENVEVYYNSFLTLNDIDDVDFDDIVEEFSNTDNSNNVYHSSSVYNSGYVKNEDLVAKENVKQSLKTIKKLPNIAENKIDQELKSIVDEQKIVQNVSNSPSDSLFKNNKKIIHALTYLEKKQRAMDKMLSQRKKSAKKLQENRIKAHNSLTKNQAKYN